VVQTQRPMRSDLRIGEKLIPGDGPVIAYRRRRQELIDAAQQAAERTDPRAGVIPIEV